MIEFFMTVAAGAFAVILCVIAAVAVLVFCGAFYEDFIKDRK